MGTRLGILGAVTCGMVAFGCSSETSKGGPAAPDPTIAITDPADKATVTIVADPDVEIRFTVTNFTLKDAPTSEAPEKKCGEAPGCGHVHISVDGHSCDDHEDGETHSFNHESATSPINAGFDYCTDVVNGVPKERTYPIVVGLYGDDEVLVMDSSGKPVTDSIEINLKVAPQDGGTSNGDGGP